jgi:DNA (cytosine-5)-methyltransferase 1
VESIQTWKKRTRWGRYKSQYFYRCPTCHREVTPYYFAAFNAIDWQIEAERIGDRKNPLKPKTIARIQYGLEQYGRQVMIVTGRYTSGLECRVKSAYHEPMPTQPGDASHAVVMPWLLDTCHTQANGKYVRSSDEPMATQTTEQSLGICAGFLSKQYGGNADPKHMAVSLDEPTGAITTWDHHAILGLPNPMMISLNDFDPRIFPASAKPSGTQTTQEKWGLVSPGFIAEMHGCSKAAPLDDPLMCLTAGGGHHALLSAGSFLSYYYGTQQASGMAEPVHTVTGLDRAALVQALDSLTVEDLYFRMLHPHEIGKAMAFPGKYVVLGTKREQVKQYGNAVTPPVMQMLIERCTEALTS